MGNIKAWHYTLGAAALLAAASSQALTVNGCVIVASPTPSSHTNCPGVNWNGQNLNGLDLSYAILSNANLNNASFVGANLTSAALNNATGNGSTDFSNATLMGVNVGNASFAGSDFTGADLRSAVGTNNTDLSNANLTSARLDYANFASVTLSGVTMVNASAQSANLANVDLSGGSDLTGANLTGATLDGADLRNATLDSANFSGVHMISILTLNSDGSANSNGYPRLDNVSAVNTNFTNAVLTSTTFINGDLTGANFTGATATCDVRTTSTGTNYCTNFTGTNLHNANLTHLEAAGARFVDATMDGATVTGLHAVRIRVACPAALPNSGWHCVLNNDYTVGQNLVLDLIGPGADLSNTDLAHSNLSGFDLSNTNLTNSNLAYADLSSTNLTGATFTDANLFGANLSGANLAGDNLAGINLYGANLTGADLAGADLTAAAMNVVDLTNADLSNANLTNAILTGAIFHNTTLVGAALAGASLPAGTQPSGLGDNAAAALGTAVTVADMNGDGYADIVVGEPLEDVLPVGKTTWLKDAGAIRIISGKDNSVIRTLYGTVANQHFGSAVAVVADQNADGMADLVVGEPLANARTTVNGKNVTLAKAGTVSLYSGADGSLISLLAQGAKAGDQFGAAVTVGDDQGAATQDLIVGAPYVDITTQVNGKNVVLKDAGQVTVFTGLTSTSRYTRAGTQAGEHFGAAVAVDTAHHLIVGSPYWDSTVVVNSKNVKVLDTGKVQVFAGADGVSAAVNAALEGAVKGDRLGSAVSGAGTDINHDGSADWLVGVPGYDYPATVNLKPALYADVGKVMLMSGLGASPVLTMTGAQAGENYGAAVCALGDVDADNTSDVVVGAPKYNVSLSFAGVPTVMKAAGRVESLSGVMLLAK